MRCDQTSAWKKLQDASSSFTSFDLSQAFAQDSHRVDAFSVQAPHVFADFSKQPINAQVQTLLFDLAEQTGVLAKRDAMFSGEPINTTENRQVMHWLLRQPAKSLTNHLSSTLKDVHVVLDDMLAFAQSIANDDTFTDVVHIGIGGSDLGPRMTTFALQALAISNKRFHFVSNVDAHEINTVLQKIRPEHTLFIFASKTFTTLETMTNAQTAKNWFLSQGGTDTQRHFAALTSNTLDAKAWGVGHVFGFWDWVGGRYSIHSSIGLPLAIAIGAKGFRDFLSGAHQMDQHFLNAPIQSNLPLRLGLLDVWHRNFLGYSSRNVAPYHAHLKYWASYLQQLELESNGKRVDLQGQALSYQTAPVLWGEPGTNGQHAFFQMLHQGTQVVPVDFLAFKHASHHLPQHQQQLLANALAQAQALMMGRNVKGGHRHMTGNRPSTFFLMDQLTPATLGAMIALHEHRVMVSGAVWGINSFDQWGVELGKVMANDLIKKINTGDASGLDASTAGLLHRIR